MSCIQEMIYYPLSLLLVEHLNVTQNVERLQPSQWTFDYSKIWGERQTVKLQFFCPEKSQTNRSNNKVVGGCHSVFHFFLVSPEKGQKVSSISRCLCSDGSTLWSIRDFIVFFFSRVWMVRHKLVIPECRHPKVFFSYFYLFCFCLRRS